MIVEFDGEYEFLSNFYHSPFTHDGITYPTNEHFFQAMKTLDIENNICIEFDAVSSNEALARVVMARGLASPGTPSNRM